MTHYILMAIAAVVGYLLGSINTAVLLSKLVYKNDIRTQGSGNAGMTNMQRVYGKKAAILTFLGDFCKGIAAVVIGWLMFKFAGYSWQEGACIAGGFAVIGHNWPLYFGFKGGKGVLTTFSVLIVITPIPTLIVFALFILVVLVTKYVSLGSILAAVFLPVIVFFIGDRLLTQGGASPVFFLTLVGSLLIIIRHHANIARLINGTESKLDLHKKK